MRNKVFIPLLFIVTLLNQSCKKDINSVKEISATQISGESSVSETLDSGLLCYFPFKSNFKDKSGNGNNGILKGTVSFVSDRFGNTSNAVSFSASNSWIEIPESNFIGMIRGTIAFDFYATSPNRQVFISKMSYKEALGTPNYYQSFLIVGEQLNTQPVEFAIRKKDFCNGGHAGWNPTLYSNQSFVLNTWNHLAVTFSKNTQKMYLNGILVGSESKTDSPICEGEPIRLGVWWQTDPLFYTGMMDEVRIYDRVLSQNEIKRLSGK